jgi:hypothetical protein
MSINCEIARRVTQVFLLAGLFAVSAAGELRAQTSSGSQQGTAATASKPVSTGSYYIEFRVAQIGTYGHSYVAYGRLNAQGRPADYHYADLHPTGNYALMALGHIVPVPATTKWDPEVLQLPVASSYRHRLAAAEYKNLLAAVQLARANKQPHWNAITNNCNHFVAQLAKAVGLRAPSDFQVSYTFIPALRDLNDPAKKPRRISAARPAGTEPVKPNN